MIMMPPHESITPFEVITAKAIYELEKNGNSVIDIKRNYWDFRALMDTVDTYDIDRIQAWQYVKAYTKILKDWHQWDHTRGMPTRTPEWVDMEPDSDDWNDWFRKHPNDRMAMHEFKSFNFPMC